MTYSMMHTMFQRFLKTFKNYTDKDEDPLAIYTFGLFKIKMSESIFILGKEPYFANIFNNEMPFLEESLLQISLFLLKIKSDYIDNEFLEEFEKTRQEFIQIEMQKEQISFDKYRQFSDLIYKGIYYYESVDTL